MALGIEGLPHLIEGLEGLFPLINLSLVLSMPGNEGLCTSYVLGWLFTGNESSPITDPRAEGQSGWGRVKGRRMMGRRSNGGEC